MKKLCSKRPFTLLEVMIAFLLVVMCIFPLIYPHAFILIEQKKFIQEIEVDRLVNLVYSDIIERLYRNEISWNPIVNGQVFPIDESYLQRIRYDKPLPYDASYRFREIRHKPKKEEQIPTHFLLNLELLFLPPGTTVGADGKLPKGGMLYTYEVFVVKDLGQEILPEEEEEEEGIGGTPTPEQPAEPGTDQQQQSGSSQEETEANFRGMTPSKILERFLETK